MRARYFTRESLIPKGAIKITPKGVNAEIYIYQSTYNGNPCAIAFSGKRNKPDLNYNYKTAERREQAILQYIESLKQSAEFKAQQRQARKPQPHSFKVGDIFHNSWGYDQTQCDFYQVISTTPYTVTLQEIASDTVEGSEGFMSDRRIAVKDAFLSNGKTLKKTVQNYDGRFFISMEHGSCSLWDGTPQYCSWYA